MTSDADLIETRYNYQYIHNVIGHFYKDTLDYFADYLYPRFEWKIVSTYEKAVEYMSKQTQYNREPDMPMKPALILNPSGDFGFDEPYGKMMWRFPNLQPGFLKYVFSPIYQDQNVIITVGFSRLKGEMEFMALLASYYEYFDVKMYINLIFGGQDRPIYPQWFNSFIILPPEVYNFRYRNPETGASYKINIADTSDTLVKTTNRVEVVYPCRILPRYKLTSMSDGSEKMGGTEKLPEWKLNFTLEYEVEIPSFIVIQSDYLLENIKYNINYGSCYSSNSTYNSNEIPVNIDSFTNRILYSDNTSYLDIDSTSPVDLSDVELEQEYTDRKQLVFNTRYFHIVTKTEEAATDIISFTLPEQILNHSTLLVNGKYGLLAYGDNYYISNDGWTMYINKKYTFLEKGDILELYVYKIT